jgi:beta-N-acetylhexosaminidase
MHAPYGPVMVDVAGHVLTKSEKKRLLHTDVGGVILFARNFESCAQLSALCAEIHGLRSPQLLIAVDHEGGRVQRFKSDGFTRLPTMRRLGEAWINDPLAAIRLATDVGFVLAIELRACGVDLSFTPVLDLDYGQSSVIGDRAFGADPRVVTLLAKNLMHGLLLGDMRACGKHFPGHGYVRADSHHEVPMDDRPLQEILSVDAAPYEWLGSSLSSLMPAHVIFPRVDKHPAGFSKIWLQTILRKQLGFDGVVFSDDLSMEGASVAGDIHGRAAAAIGAGCDMVLVCNAPEMADALLDRRAPAISEASRTRIARLMPRLPAKTWKELQSNKAYLAAKKAISALK